MGSIADNMYVLWPEDKGTVDEVIDEVTRAYILYACWRLEIYNILYSPTS